MRLGGYWVSRLPEPGQYVKPFRIYLALCLFIVGLAIGLWLMA